MKTEEDIDQETVLNEDESLSAPCKEHWDDDQIDDDDDEEEEHWDDDQIDDDEVEEDEEDESDPDDNDDENIIANAEDHVAFVFLSANGKDTLKNMDDDVCCFFRQAAEMIIPMKDENDTDIEVKRRFIWRDDRSQVATYHGPTHLIDLLRREIPKRAKRLWSTNNIVPLKKLDRDTLIGMIERQTNDVVKSLKFCGEVSVIKFKSGREETLSNGLLCRLCKTDSIVLSCAGESECKQGLDDWPFSMAFYN